MTRPLQFVGLFIHRLLLTLQFTSKNYFLLLFCILSFSISFNLMHHRHEGDQDSTYNSLYGSFLQSFIFAFGGYDALDLFDSADSPLIMSLYFPLFIICVMWILIAHLFVSMNEIYQETECKAICLWRENQTEVILSKSFLLKEEIENNIFHHPKWLQILKPLYQQEYKTSSSASSSCCCDMDSSTKESIDDIRRDVELLKDMFHQFQDNLNGFMQLQSLQGTSRQPQSDYYSETQLLDKIKLLMEQHCQSGVPNPSQGGAESQAPDQLTVLRLPPKEDDEKPSTHSSPNGHKPLAPLRTFSRAISETDNADLRLPNDSTSNEKKNKSETGLRVRQIKSSKKKLSSKILGLDFDQTT